MKNLHLFLFSFLLAISLNVRSQVSIISPNGGETWVNNSEMIIVYENQGEGDFFEVLMSTDNGDSFSIITYSYGYTGMNYVFLYGIYPVSNEALIQISGYYSNPSVSDVSDSVFSIVNPPLLILTPYYYQYTYLNQPVDVTWLSNDPNKTVDVELSTDNGTTWTNVGSGISGTAWSFTAPEANTDQARVKITNTADPSEFAISEPFFIVGESQVEVVSPNGGEVWDFSAQYADITWTGTELFSYVVIYFSNDDGATWEYMTSTFSSATGGTLSVPIPSEATDRARIKVVDGSGQYDVSDASFSIVGPPLTVFYPNASYINYAGGMMYINWQAFDSELVKIEISTNNGNTYTTIDENVDAALGYYYYSIPENMSGDQCLVRISDQNDPQINDLSELFVILDTPALTLLTPVGGEFINAGEEYEIQWVYDNIIYGYAFINVEFSSNNGLSWQLIGSVYQFDEDGSLSWDVPNIDSDQCLIRISDAYSYNIIDITETVFTVRDIPSTPICLVSVDQFTGNNTVIWEPVESNLISEYVIYRETNQFDVYEEIGTVPQGAETMFQDGFSNSLIQASRYKLGFRDANGLEYPMSNFHQTIHLTLSPGVGNSWNLIWSPYLGFQVQSYRIYRAYDPSSMELIATISGSFNSYTDFDAVGGQVYYMVEVVSPNSCVVPGPSGGSSYGSSSSNIASTMITSISDQESPRDMVVYPVPASHILNVRTPVSYGETNIRLINNMGQMVKDFRLQPTETGRDFSFDVSGLPKGMYLISVSSQNETSSSRVIIGN